MPAAQAYKRVERRHRGARQHSWAATGHRAIGPQQARFAGLELKRTMVESRGGLLHGRPRARDSGSDEASSDPDRGLRQSTQCRAHQGCCCLRLGQSGAPPNDGGGISTASLSREGSGRRHSSPHISCRLREGRRSAKIHDVSHRGKPLVARPASSARPS